MGETIIPLPDPIPPATAIRGTVIVTSQQLIRQTGREADYWEALPKPDAKDLREVIASMWVPMDLAVQHYQAVESLGFSSQEAYQNGLASSARVNESFIGTLARSLRAAGTLSPLALIERFDRVIGRLSQGGGVKVVKLGPKEVRMEIHRIPITQFAYCRDGWRGLIEGGVALFAKRAFVRHGPPPAPDAISYLISWV